LDQPKCKVFNKNVNWLKPDDMDAYQPAIHQKMLNGILKVLVVPPIGSKYPPVLPMRVNDRLLFSFCATCSKKYKVGCKNNEYFCQHFDWRKRAFVATTTSAELREALLNGYCVKKLYRGYYFEVWSTQLFARYVKKFLTIKIHASGWPSECTDNVSKQQFIDQQLNDYDIVINPANMIFNAGLRYISKVMLHKSNVT
jgi:hypothetical protein